MKGIRFRKDCYDWIIHGCKTTTFRKTRRNGIYEIVEGDIYHPKGQGIFILMKPIKRCEAQEVIDEDYSTEGPFDTKEEFIKWLDDNALKLPEDGWLNSIEYVERKNNEN